MQDGGHKWGFECTTQDNFQLHARSKFRGGLETPGAVSVRQVPVKLESGTGAAGSHVRCTTTPRLAAAEVVLAGPISLKVAVPKPPVCAVQTRAGFLYLAIALDVFSRRVVGWAMANHLRTELVLEALDMAIFRRRPKGVIHHSDQGCQYTSIAFENEAVRPTSGRRWGPSATATITRCARASTLRSNAGCWRSTVSRPNVKPHRRSSTSSKAGITRTAGIRHWVISHPTTTSGE